LLGLFDDPYRYLDENRAKANTEKPEFIETARKAVASSLVLLKNDNDLLPIKKDRAARIALIGPLMNDSVNLNGEWAGLGDRNKSVSILKGMTEAYKGTNVKLNYAQGCTITESSPASIAQAVSAARNSDVVLVAVGEDFNWSGRSSLS